MAHLQSTSKDSGSVSSDTLAFGSAVTAGSLLVVSVRLGGVSATVAITDDKGNTWTQDKLQAQGTDHRLSVHSAPNAAAGATTLTATITGGPTTLRWAIHEYGSMATSAPVDVSAGAEGADSTSMSSGSNTTTVANCLLFGAASVVNTFSPAAGSGYTLRQTLPASPNTKVASEDQDLVATGSWSATMTGGGASNGYACIMVAYKPAAGGATPLTAQLSESLIYG